MTTIKRGHCCSRSAFGKVRFSGHKKSPPFCPLQFVRVSQSFQLDVDNIFGNLVAKLISTNNDQANRIEKGSKEVTEMVKLYVKQLENKDKIIKEKTAIIQKNHAVMTHLAWD